MASCAGAAGASFDGLNFKDGVALGTVNTAAVDEASGITVSRLNAGVFWTHNDGSNNDVYAFRMNGALLGRFRLGRSTVDVEDIASGPGPKANTQYLYVGDIGSNSASRDRVRIFRVEEPVVDLAWASNPVSRTFSNVAGCDLVYPDGTYNAEGLLVDGVGGKIYVVTKQSFGARIYGAALSALTDGGIVMMEFGGEVGFDFVSGGAMSADGSIVALRREEFAMAWERRAGESVMDALERPGTLIPVVGTPVEPNGEGISFLPDGSGYVTISEGMNQPVYFFERRTVTCEDAPQFLGAPFADGDGVRLSFTACNRRVAVDRATVLAPPNWGEVAQVDIVDGFGGYVDSAAGGTRFYRLRVLE